MMLRLRGYPWIEAISRLALQLGSVEQGAVDFNLPRHGEALL